MKNLKILNKKKIILLSIILLTILLGILILTLSLRGNKKSYYATIRQNEIGNDLTLEETTRLEGYSSKSPLLTFFVTGQGGVASNWSNNSNPISDDEKGLTYDETSIIEGLRADSTDTDIYLAQVKKEEKDFQFSLSLCEKPSVQRKSYIFKTVTKLEKIKSHTIILFQQLDKDERSASHNVVYEQLNFLIDTLSFDIRSITGSIPKINLIGHSRGGLINLMYASKHPFNVDSIYSLGSPYLGSNLGNLTPLVNALGISDSINCDSGKDIMNVNIQNKLKSDWEKAYSLNPKINAHALGGAIDMTFLSKFLIVEREKLNSAIGQNLPKELYNAISMLIKSPITQAGLGLLGVGAGWLTSFLESLGVSVAGMSGKALDDVVKELVYVNFMNKDLYSDYFGLKNNSLILLDDIFIDLESQLATGYSGFKKFTKVFNDKNTNFDRKGWRTDLAIPHNLEARDIDFANYIRKDIDLNSANKLFSTYTNNDNTLTIIGFNTSNQNVIIPEVIDGRIVSEISSNLFNKNENTKIKSIELPNTIIKIREKAFSNFKYLNEISIGKNTSYIDEEAFSECNSLEKITVSQQNLNYSSSSGILYDYRKERLIKVPTNKNISKFTVLNSVKVISSNAFENNNLMSIDLNNSVTYISKEAFKGAVNLKTVTNSYAIKNVGRDAFLKTQFINTSDKIILGSCLVKYETNEEIIDLRKIDDKVRSLADGLFVNSSSLKKVIISKNIDDIGSETFIACSDLEEVVILSNNFTLNDDCFTNTSKKRTIKVTRKTYNRLIEENSHYKNELKIITTKVIFDVNDGTNKKVVLEIEYDSFMEFPNYMRLGYEFTHFIDGNNNKYVENHVWNLIDENITLTARWKVITYGINYELDGGTNNINNKIQYTVEDNIDLLVPIKKGYTFLGWKNESNQFISQIEKGTIGDLKLVANWRANNYQVNLDALNNTGMTKQTVTYDKDFNLPIPKKDGHDFKGWFIDNIMYTNENGNSIRNWDIDANTVLTASWKIKTFYIELVIDGKKVWITENSLTTNKESIDYNSDVITVDELNKAFKKSTESYIEGYEFKFFTYQKGDKNTRITNLWDKVPDLGVNETTISFYPFWEKEEYLIVFENTNPIKANYSDSISLPIESKVGYTFIHWEIYDYEYSFNSLKNGEKFSYTRMIDITPNVQSNGRIYLKAIFIANKYELTLNSNGGSEVIKQVLVTFDSNYKLPIPNKIGYQFLGWRDTNENVSLTYNDGNSVDVWKMAKNNTLFARWEIINYKIEYLLNGGTNSDKNISTYTIENQVTLYDIEKFGFVFSGWTINGIKVTNISNKNEDLVVIANWNGYLYKYDTGVSNSYNESILILDFSNYSNVVRSYITLKSTVQQVTLIGNSKVVFFDFNIIISNRTTDILIKLKDINAVASENNDLISSNANINLEYYGLVQLCGGNSTNTEKLIGRTAILAASLKIEKGSGTLLIMGGTGYTGLNGVNGNDGKKGLNGGLFTRGKIVIFDGEKGKNGTNGTAGQTGGTGGYGIEVTNINISSNLTGISIIGGTGGRGGIGGNGGRGGKGGNSITKIFCTTDGGNGGAGGNGGSGGDAGAGGKGTKDGKLPKNVKTDDGKKGTPGIGGSAGSGGKGGKGAGAIFQSGTNGKTGSSGYHGTNGNS